jgi:hypothetical protein
MKSFSGRTGSALCIELLIVCPFHTRAQHRAHGPAEDWWTAFAVSGFVVLILARYYTGRDLEIRISIARTGLDRGLNENPVVVQFDIHRDGDPFHPVGNCGYGESKNFG